MCKKKKKKKERKKNTKHNNFSILICSFNETVISMNGGNKTKKLLKKSDGLDGIN